MHRFFDLRQLFSCCRPSTKPVIKIDYASNYKAVIFDMGGVVLQLKEPQLLHAVLEKANSDGAKEKFGKMFMQWETGELPLDEFRKHILEIVGPTDVFDSGEKFMTAFLGPPDEHICKAIKRIRAAGLKTALLTNTGFDSALTKRPLIMKELEDFDAVVLSCELGQRKPGAEIYMHTAKQLGVKLEECIFLDDVLKNCEGAEDAGMASIPVPHGETLLAVQELQKLLDIKLLD